MKMSEQQTTLHYVYDPLCGWCYGAAPLLQVAATIAGLKIELHAGGLWMGSRRQPMGEALRDYVRPHDQRIEALTGQHFGERYFNELLLREGCLLDSEPPIRAVLAVTALGGDGLVMLLRIQQFHYRDGIWIGEPAFLATLAAEQGIAAEAFQQAYLQAPLLQHLADSQGWMKRLGGQGYPTLGLMHNGKVSAVRVADFLGDPAGLRQHLLELME
ncbi:DsbA family protein [Aeromonas veronii]|uniref:DsbA family protein n=1 Tax=Aeromonas TaxID=642 RepID=UPI00071875A4|nr:MULTISPECIES: DsbA family protein [Aeromonas]KRV85671.1 protein-disulfide isomerase [Aeromonas veronii]KRW01118.1 protein-disulfide isomerase [Aeromonas veronii]KRW07138.1 protein-disulfide isomerase [Aeromonas veronii]KRW09111.1 protein-disulfide isomerase [Aeromonas veronii]KRW20491.1 protein-disulfide isomerase [Aeromonas veronii]